MGFDYSLYSKFDTSIRESESGGGDGGGGKWGGGKWVENTQH